MDKAVQPAHNAIHNTRWMRSAAIVLAWSYAGFVALWFVLHARFGDTVWWIALLNTFAPLLFVPLVVLLPASLIWRWRPFWSATLPPLLIFVLMYGELFVPALPATLAAEPEPFTLMSFNMWEHRPSHTTAQVLIQNDLPDIVVVQELSRSMAILIRDELGEVYPHHAWDFARALGVFSRYPLTQVQSPLLEYDDMRVQVVRVQMQERSLLLYNCHPFSMKTILELLPTDTSLEDVVANNFYSRTSFMQRLAADLDTQTGPVVVAGDLNSTDQSDAYALLQSRLTNAHQAAGWGLGHTFPADGTRHIGGTSIPARLMRLDMIFYSDELVALDSYVSATHGASDHMPVLATLAWRSPYSP